MRALVSIVSAVVLTALLSACGLWTVERPPEAAVTDAGTDQAAPAQASPTPAPAPEPVARIDLQTIDPATMTAEQATSVVEQLMRTWPVAPDNKLAHPASIDDVLAILKLDQVTLFPLGVAYLASVEGPEAASLHAQIELAWGEAYQIMATLQKIVRQQLSGIASYLAKDAEKNAAQIEQLNKNLHELDVITGALEMEAAAHGKRGADLAEAFIAANPDSYLGYRLGADYYRLNKQWVKFDEMVVKLKEKNPDSNGLVFLEGAAAYQKNKDMAKATELFTKALAKDPAFVRAQAHMMYMQTELPQLHAELLKLEAANPDHQLVKLLGSKIKSAFARTQK